MIHKKLSGDYRKLMEILASGSRATLSDVDTLLADTDAVKLYEVGVFY